MPTYSAYCAKCCIYQEYIRSVNDRHVTPTCYECGGATVLAIQQAPLAYIKGRFEAFKSPVDGTIISNERELRRHNARNNVVPLGEGYSEGKVLSGDFGGKRPTLDNKERLADIGAAIQQLNQGYKPHIGKQDADE